jgi:hypothetical protein
LVYWHSGYFTTGKNNILLAGQHPGLAPKTDMDAVAKKKFLLPPLILTQEPNMWVLRNVYVLESLDRA